jgi:nucleoside-diphosphate-sugar epimerase
VLVVSYDDPSALAYTLKGVDLVISTINGKPQLALLNAAAAAQVRHFIPSGFSGPEQCSPQSTIKSDWQDLTTLLQFHEAQSSMRYTIFTCGVFYEQFGPGGLNALQISTFNNDHASIGQEGDLLVDFRAGRATTPVIPGGEEAAICMTSARDVARYVVAALQAYEDLTMWPQEFKFCTERFTMTELVILCGRVRGEFLPNSQYSTHAQCILQIPRNSHGGRGSSLSEKGHVPFELYRVLAWGLIGSRCGQVDSMAGQVSPL